MKQPTTNRFEGNDMTEDELKAAAAALGRKGGLAKSAAKTIAVRANARKRWDAFRQSRAAGEAEQQTTHNQTRKRKSAANVSSAWTEFDFWLEYVKTVWPDAVPLYETFVTCGARLHDCASHALVKCGRRWDHYAVLGETERRLKARATSEQRNIHQ